MRKKSGPKPKAPSKVRTEPVTIFMTKAEKRRLIRIANRSSGRQSLSRVAHALLIRAMEEEL